MREQTRLGSLTESVLNVLIGYMIAVTSQILVFPFFGIFVPLKTNILIGIIFTFISIARSFFIRRLFNYFQRR